MTRKQAYERLALIAVAIWVLVSVVERDVLVGALVSAAVFAAGFLGIELGLRRRGVTDLREDD